MGGDITCVSDEGCGFLHFCDLNKVCSHEDITFGLIEIASYCMIILIVGLANVGGIGGGIVKLPLLVLVLNFSIQAGTYISYPIILGGVISNVILLLNQRHPRKDRPVIDFNLVIVLLPAILLGTNVGVLMNTLLPELILSIVFAVFLCFVCPYFFFKAQNLYKEECEKAGITQKNDESASQIKESDSNQSQYQLLGQNENEVNMSEELKSIIQEEKRTIPFVHTLFMVLVFVAVQVIGILKGGKALPSILGVEKCDNNYFLLVLLQLALCVGAQLIAVVICKNDFEKRVLSGYRFDQNDIPFSLKSIMLIIASGVLAGLVTGMLAMGAGMVVIPVLLQLGWNPRVASATSGFMYLFIGSSSILFILAEGYLSVWTLSFYAVIGLLGGLVVSRFVYNIVRQYDNQSSIIWILFFLAVLNLLSTFYYIYLKQKEYGWQKLMESKSFCDA